MVKNLPAMQETLVRFLGWGDLLERGKSDPLQYSGLENSMDCIVHGVAKSPWKKSYDQPRQHIAKQRHYFANKGPSSQGYGFSSSPIWCESWTMKKAECQIIDAFELLCWRGLLRFPWTARISNQSILKKSELNIHWKG